MKHDEEHIDIREKLLKLPRVKAKDGFENELMRRINLLETEKQPERRSAGIFDLLFGKRSLVWSIPAMSLTVVAIVVVGVYIIFYNNGDITKKQDSSITKTEQTTAPVVPPSSVTKTDENKPGKEIANDLEIGKTPGLEKKTEIHSGYGETSTIQSAPKMESERSRDELKSTDKSVKQSEEVMQKIIQPTEKQESVNKGAIEDKKKEMPRKIEESKKDNAISPKKINEDVEKSEVMSKETGKDVKKDEKKEAKKKKSNKETDLTKEVLESLSKKIKDNQ
ncbi:MAG: hypothetical protein PHN88_00205 [Ignavibacteria bacterium]|nr:hypothetical protein [Ignavibacteria bacterium]